MKKVSMQDIANKLGVSKGTALVPYIHQPLLELLKESKDNNAITVVNTVYDFLREKKNPNNAWSYGEYMIGTTLFYKIEFKHTLNGSPKTLTIESRNRSRENIYVQSLLLNGNRTIVAIWNIVIFFQTIAVWFSRWEALQIKIGEQT